MLSSCNSGLKQLQKENYDGIVSCSRDVMQEFEDNNEFQRGEQRGDKIPEGLFFFYYGEKSKHFYYVPKIHFLQQSTGKEVSGLYLFSTSINYLFYVNSLIFFIYRSSLGGSFAQLSFFYFFYYLKNSMFSPMF